MKTIRLILGDQLNYEHSWFTNVNANVTYVMFEMTQETNYVKHHIQKIVGFFLSMQAFSNFLKSKGHNVIYYTLDDPKNTQCLTENLQQLINKEEFENLEYLLPDEYRLDKQLKTFCESLSIQWAVKDTEHFYTTRNELQSFYKGKKQIVMEYFYRDMRKKHSILMQDSKNPEGGSWNFDKKNRKAWKGSPAIPKAKTFSKDASALINLLDSFNIDYFGAIDSKSFNWPTNRQESLKVLEYFCENLLIHFGDYQDAMHPNEFYLFHSRLSFALNTKMLSPKEVINTVLDYYYEHKEQIDISQVEGFVRQILGWREFMRGMYWKEMPGYENKNSLENTNALPEFYWTGNTKMSCLKHSIKQSLDHAYAHHIQRLMITGNYALLTQTHPDDVDNWYLGVYIDAIQWVEITNTRGMSQFADGGIIATKPYDSSGNYINKMSQYCKGCAYKVSKTVTEDACPFNSLYWNFLDDKRPFFENNNRMAMMLSLLDKKSKKDLIEIKERAQNIMKHPENY